MEEGSISSESTESTIEEEEQPSAEEIKYNNQTEGDLYHYV